jgi:hypothetical protein
MARLGRNWGGGGLYGSNSDRRKISVVCGICACFKGESSFMRETKIYLNSYVTQSNEAAVDTVQGCNLPIKKPLNFVA